MSTLELFSDLVMVVAIHIVAEPLEEIVVQEKTTIMVWYLVRVLLLFQVWLGQIFFMNSAVVFRNATCPLHHGVVFVWMALVLFMTQEFAKGRDATALGVFLGARALEVVSYTLQVGEDHANLLEAGILTNATVNNLRSLVPILWKSYLFCELLPLLAAIGLQNGTGTPFLPAIVISLLAHNGSHIWAARLSDQRRGGKPLTDALDVDHLPERFELITLIFIGEICFAAGKPSDNAVQYWVTAAALGAAISSYLLLFTARRDSTNFWGRSAMHMVCGFVLYAGLFCVIPLLGASYARILEAAEEEPDDDHFPEAAAAVWCHPEKATMLCYATTAFLVVSSLISLLDAQASFAEYDSTVLARFALRITCGGAALLWTRPAVLISVVGCLGPLPSATFVCPALAIFSAMVEVWAVGSLQWATRSGMTLSFTVTE